VKPTFRAISVSIAASLVEARNDALLICVSASPASTSHRINLAANAPCVVKVREKKVFSFYSMAGLNIA